MNTLKIFVVDYIGIPLQKAYKIVKEFVGRLRDKVTPPATQFISKAHTTLAPPKFITSLIRKIKEGGAK